MAKIDVTKTELVWPGKYNEDGTLREAPRVNLPFQVIETVNESRATREARDGQRQSTLFDVYKGDEGETFEDGWKNKLIWGDNLLVMGSLLERFAGKVDLIYIDPPFATGADYSFNCTIGDSECTVTKQQSAIEEKAYRDTWRGGHSTYLEMMTPRLLAMRKMLSQTGTIYVHCDSTVGHYIRCLMDDVFGPENFRNEIVWHYGKMSNATRNFPRNHDTILRYTKSDDFKFSPVKNQESEYRARFSRYLTGNQVLYGSVKGSKDRLILGRKKKVSASLGRDLMDSDVLFDFDNERKTQSDVVYCPIIKGNAGEYLGFRTQKPRRLVETLIEASTQEGDLVLDGFSGSGTTAEAAEQFGRRWICCDFGRWGIHLTRKRLLRLEQCRPFEILNLGKYERRYWLGATFGENRGGAMAERAVYEYLAFVLKLYGAAPLAGSEHLHGKKGAAMVHIGGVDSPVTIDDVNRALEETAGLRQKELHVLGWEWEMGMAGSNELQRGGLMHHEAVNRGVKLVLLQIPQEVMEQQAVDQGDVRFFELAFLDAEVVRSRGLCVEAALRDFVIPNAELIPNEVREKVKKWSDYIDYWAVDWDFQNDTFMQGWVTYRTRKDRRLALTSDRHTYSGPGRYRILVKVIDIFGNDTSQAIDVEVA